LPVQGKGSTWYSSLLPSWITRRTPHCGEVSPVLERVQCSSNASTAAGEGILLLNQGCVLLPWAVSKAMAARRPSWVL
jgi:hypothetical protein